MSLPNKTDDPYFYKSKVTHKAQTDPDAVVRLDALPEAAQMFKPEPGKNTLSCAADLGTGFVGKVRLLVFRGKLNGWCIDDSYNLPPSGQSAPGKYTFVFKTGGHLVALWLEEASGGTLNSMEGVLIDAKTGGF
jgi:hypothetical protein